LVERQITRHKRLNLKCYRTSFGLKRYLPAFKADDNLTFADIEMAIANGRINRKFTRDPRGTRYEVIGPAIDKREIAIICRIKSTGKLLLITTYTLEE
jgi:hypothetical protein